jgi:hypothetical protein
VSAAVFSPPGLDDVQQRILDSMRSDGIAVVDFRELHGDEVWQRLAADIGAFARDTESRLPELLGRKDTKAYIARRFGKTKTAFTPADPWVALGLSGRMLDVVSSYRGERAWFVDFDNWYTIPDPAATDRVASQRWHRDPWDDHVIKVFTYFSDVDEEAGPFEYIRSSPGGGRYGDLWPWESGGGDSVYPPQDELAAAVDPADVMTLTGPAGTTIFCDTSGFHRGGLARSRPRVLSYHAFVSPRTRKPPRLRLDLTGGTEALDDDARFAVSWSK